MLAQIVKMVADAQRSRAPIQGLADKVVGNFVPTVVAVAAITFGIWYFFGPEPRLAYAIVNAVAVLIIACPCAFGLATPMSIMVGIGRGAQEGVLVKNAEGLELLGKVRSGRRGQDRDFDGRTATVVDVIPNDGVRRTTLVQLAASLERSSEHPLAAAIVRGAQKTEKDFVTNDRIPFRDRGRRRRESIEGRQVIVGKSKFLEAERVEVPQRLARARGELQAEGKTVLLRLESTVARPDCSRSQTR